MSVQTLIQHHPSRKHLLYEITEKVGAARVVTDPDPDHPLRSPWRTYLHCLEHLPGSSHTLIIQDDALPCRNFQPALERIAEAVPDLPVVLFLPGAARSSVKNVYQASTLRQSYADLAYRDFLPVVAVLWPRAAAIRFRDWALANPRATGGTHQARSDDAMAGKWQRTQRERVLVTVPSLVDHDDSLTPSLIRDHATKRDKGRRAALFIGDADPLALNWVLPPR